jgi:enamine deaminase RidA (YjgF/YER057c/UK114 family)
MSGQLARDPAVAEIEAQLREIFARMDAKIQAALTGRKGRKC